MDPFTIAMVGTSVLSSIFGQASAASAADRRRDAEMLGATMKFAMSEASVNLMKGANREAAGNAIGEMLRAGAAQSNDIKGQIEQATSTVQASNEGITSGRSKGRQMIALQVKGNQAVLESKSKVATSIAQITDQMDKATNELNNKLFSDYNQMAAVLTTPGAVYQGNPMEILQSGISGAAAGASIGKNMSASWKTALGIK